MLEKVADKTYKLILPPHMHIFSVMNVENIKLYRPSMLDQEEEHVLPYLEDFLPYSQGKLTKDAILHRSYRIIRQM